MLLAQFFPGNNVTCFFLKFNSIDFASNKKKSTKTRIIQAILVICKAMKSFIKQLTYH